MIDLELIFLLLFLAATALIVAAWLRDNFPVWQLILFLSLNAISVTMMYHCLNNWLYP